MAFGLLGVVVPAKVTRLTVQPSLLQALLWALLIYCAAAITHLVYVGSPRFVRLMFLCYVYTFLALAGAAQVQANYFPDGGTFPTGQLLTSVLIVWAGLIAAEVGYFSSSRRHNAGPRTGARRLLVTRTQLISIASLAVCLVIVLRTGGFGVLFTSRQAAINAAFGGSAPSGSQASGATVAALRNLPVFVCFVALATLARSRAGGSARSRVSIPLAVALLALNLIVNNPVGNARLWAATVLLATLVAIYPPRSARHFRVLATATIITMAVVFPYADRFRYTNQDAPTQHRSIQTQLISNGGYDSFQLITTGVDDVDRHGLLDGKQLLGDALFFVPRSTWHGKPMYTGAVLSADGNYVNPNLSAPLWIEGYVDFGWVGVLLYLGLFGWVAGRLDRRYIAAVRSPNGLVTHAAFIPMLAAYSVQLLRGPILPAMGPLVVLIVLPIALLGGAPHRGAIAEDQSDDLQIDHPTEAGQRMQNQTRSPAGPLIAAPSGHR